jgi:hypothetical protein
MAGGLRPLPEIAAEKGACLLTRNQDRNLAIFFKNPFAITQKFFYLNGNFLIPV